jgi:GT2 family glycosyltransferase
MNIDNLPTIMIGCPVANRRYLINRHLEGLYKIDYPKDKIKLYFLVNNSNDGTESELNDFRDAHKNEYMDIVIEKFKMPHKKDRRVTGYRNETYRRLVELRNYVLTKVDTDYFFSVDSDIIVKENVLLELLNAQKDIIAAVINNDRILRPYNSYPNIRTNLLIHDGIGVTHYLNFPLNQIIEVGYTGAVYLMTKKVTEEVKYDYSTLGEDIPFCENARKLGYKIYAHTGLWQEHVMCEYQEYCIENCCQNPCTSVNKKVKVYRHRYIDNVTYPKLALCPKLVKGILPLLKN